MVVGAVSVLGDVTFDVVGVVNVFVVILDKLYASHRKLTFSSCINSFELKYTFVVNKINKEIINDKEIMEFKDDLKYKKKSKGISEIRHFWKCMEFPMHLQK